MNGDYQARVASLKSDLDRLLASEVWRLGDLVRHTPVESQVGGVYLLSLPSDPQVLVYVGRTKSKSIHGRICDHRSINTASDLKGMLLRWPNCSQVAEDYGVRWVAVEDPAHRASIELFAIAVLAPLFNRS